MCIICVGLDNKTLTPWEAARNRREFLDILDDEHLEELDHKIRDALKAHLNDLNRLNAEEAKD